MKKIEKLILVYFLSFIGYTICYCFLFHTFLFSWEKVLFFRGLYLLFINTGCFLSMLFFFYKKKYLHFETIVSILIMCISLNLCFFVVVPVTVDRSLSVFILHTLEKENAQNKNCNGLKKSEIQNKLVSTYILSKSALAKRLTEQNIINNVQLNNNDCISLTKKGRMTMDLFRFFGYLYGVSVDKL